MCGYAIQYLRELYNTRLYHKICWFCVEIPLLPPPSHTRRCSIVYKHQLCDSMYMYTYTYLTQPTLPYAFTHNWNDPDIFFNAKWIQKQHSFKCHWQDVNNKHFPDTLIFWVASDKRWKIKMNCWPFTGFSNKLWNWKQI